MSSVEKSEVQTDSITEKDKSSGDKKVETSPHKRAASELSSEDGVKQKVLKTDHKENDKENGEDKYEGEEGDEGDDDEDDDDVVPEGDDYEEGEGGDDDGVDDEGDEDDDEEA